MIAEDDHEMEAMVVGLIGARAGLEGGAAAQLERDLFPTCASLHVATPLPRAQVGSRIRRLELSCIYGWGFMCISYYYSTHIS